MLEKYRAALYTLFYTSNIRIRYSRT